jgi:hypothetical protein
MKRVLADIDADNGDLTECRAGHECASANAAKVQLCSPVGREHGWTIPLAVESKRMSFPLSYPGERSEVYSKNLGPQATWF